MNYQDFIFDPLEINTLVNLEVDSKKKDLERFSYTNKKDSLVDYSFDLTRFDHLQKVKEIYSIKDPKLTAHLYPYEYVNNSIFNNRAALKLANLDLLFNLTGYEKNLYNPINHNQWRYADLCFAPGGFSQYLQYRDKAGFVYGITYKEDLSWKEEDLDMKRFENIVGRSGLGDLLIDYKDFIKKVGILDLIVADGGMEIKDSSQKEKISSLLILAEMIIGVSSLRVGGDFVVKMFDTVTKSSAEIIYLMSLFFEKIYLFKPIMSRSTNAEKYLICKKRNNYNDPEIINKIESIIDLKKEIKIFEKLPQNFMTWFTSINNLFIEKQIFFAEQITQLYNKKFIRKIKANLHLVLIELYLPGERFKYEPKINHKKRNF